MTQGIDIPVKIEGNDALVMLARIVNALEGTGRAATNADPPAKRLGVTLRGVGESARHLNEIRELTLSWAHALLNAAERVGELAGQQERLNAHSSRLGLDFQRAADAAGGFVSEMQTMQLATALANRNISVTQSELDALARVGMARAASAGKNVEEVFDSIGDSIIEGGEELEKFGSELHSVADDSHTASDRLGALVQRGREVEGAMRTSGDEVHRFGETINRVGRTISASFANEFARLEGLGPNIRGARDEAEEFNRTMDAIGRTAAVMVERIGRGIGAVAGSIALMIGQSIAHISTMAAGVETLATTRSLSATRAAMGRAYGEATGPGSIYRDIQDFTERQFAMLSALSEDADPRTQGPAADRAGPERMDMVITAQSEGIDPRTGRPIRAQSRGGGGGSRPRRTTIEDLMGRAFERPRAELGSRRQEMELTDMERGGIEAAADARRRDAELAMAQRSRTDRGLRERAQAEMMQRREERELDRRFNAQRSFTEQLEDLSYRRMTLAEEEANSVNGAFRSMGKAFSDHLTAVVQGREEIGAALQGILADTLKSIGEESAIKAGLNLAEGFAALATYRYDAAAQHFAAFGIYTAVATAAGAAGAALTPNAASKGKDSAPSSSRSASPTSSSASAESKGMIVNVAFNGPQYGTGGVVQAAREIAGVLNAGAIQGGVQLNRLTIPAGAR